MSLIHDIYAREVLDSRGNPTIEVEVYLNELQRGEFVASVSKDTGLLKALANLIATAERSQSSFFKSLKKIGRAHV